MLKLYFSPGVASIAPHIALRMAGADFSLEAVPLMAGAHRTEAYLKVNPHARVPALAIGDDEILTEAVAILRYIGETWPEANLIPTAPRERRRADELLMWAAATLGSATFPGIYRPGRFAEDDGARREVNRHSLARLPGQLAWLEARLAAQDGAGGPDVRIADLYIYVMHRLACRTDLELGAYPAFCELAARVEALPAAKEALAEEGLI